MRVQCILASRAVLRGLTFACLFAFLGLLSATSATVRAQTGNDTGTWPFLYPDDTRPNCLLNLRYLNEKSAGETGFIRLSPDGDGFALGNGKPVRFWSVVTDGYKLKPDLLARHARFLARLGVNMVRLHTQISAPGPNGELTAVNSVEIDGIWRCVAAMKKEGIYCTISPYWATGKDVTRWGIDGYTGTTDLWGVLFFNETLQRGYRAWVKKLYGEVNPYTGTALCNEPAVAIIQVQNEDGMFFWTMQGLHPEQKALLGKKFAVWLAKKYGSLTTVRNAWPGATNDKDDFDHQLVGILDTWVLTQPQTGGMEKRAADQTQFFAETQRKFYSDIADYYHRDLGCKQIINASNWITADPIRLNDLERYTYTADGASVIAVNRYTGGVHTGPNNGWRIDPGHHFTSNSCLLDPRSLPFNLKQVAGHPMIITESSWVNPEGFQSEAPFLTAAYESLTGVSSLYWFAAGGTPEYDPDPYFNFLNFNGQHPMNKWTCSTPTLMGGFPAAALMYRMGYIRKGAAVVHEERALGDMWRRQDPIIAEDRTFDPNRNSGNTGGKSVLQKGIDPLAFLVGRVEVVYGGDPQKTQTIDLTPYIDSSAHTIKSITGEVNLDFGHGVCVVNSPRAQGACGFFNKVPDIKLQDVTLHCSNAYATISCVSLDNEPLAKARRILVQIGTQARPTGWSAKPTDFNSDDGKQTFQGYEIVTTGTMPWRINRLDASLILHNANISKATTLDAAGYATAQIPISRSGETVKLQLPPDALYLILE